MRRLTSWSSLTPLLGPAVAVLLLTTLPGCGSAPRLPNVILVVFDTTRFDDWSWLDPSRRVTPLLDSLATRGQRFTNARSLYPVTVPSHVSLFTGSEVPQSGQVRVGYDDASLFAILRARGYRTYAFSGNPAVQRNRLDVLWSVDVTVDGIHRAMPEERLDEILRHYGEFVEDPGALPAERRREYFRNSRYVRGSADLVNEAALDAMRRHVEEHAERPFFLFLNYNDAHDPYFPEEPFDSRFRSPGATDFNGNIRSPERRRHDVGLTGLKLSLTAEGLSEGDIARARDLHLGELAFADDRFARLLERLDELELLGSTVIVATSDHGELFGEYGRMCHSGEPYEELLRVPLVMTFPDEFGPRELAERVDLRDVKPTLLDYLGIEDDSSVGRSLMGLIRGETTVLEPASPFEPAAWPVDAAAQNLIPGQDPLRHERLLEELRALGYVE